MLGGAFEFGGIGIADDKIAASRPKNFQSFGDQGIIGDPCIKFSLPDISCIPGHSLLDGKFTADIGRPEYFLQIFIQNSWCQYGYCPHSPGIDDQAGKNLR